MALIRLIIFIFLMIAFPPFGILYLIFAIFRLLGKKQKIKGSDE